MMKKYLIILSLCFFTALSVNASHVPGHESTQQNTGGSGPTNTGGSDQRINTEIPNPFSCGGQSDENCTISNFFQSIVERVLLPIGGVVAVIAFIWSGFMFVTAQGDPGKIKTARTALWYTAIGTAILLGAVAIASVIKNTIEALG
ncbi:MAG: pilin [Minisyncoccota bacterium]